MSFCSWVPQQVCSVVMKKIILHNLFNMISLIQCGDINHKDQISDENRKKNENFRSKFHY